jgi:hypothetical protein
MQVSFLMLVHYLLILLVRLLLTGNRDVQLSADSSSPLHVQHYSTTRRCPFPARWKSHPENPDLTLRFMTICGNGKSAASKWKINFEGYTL